MVNNKYFRIILLGKKKEKKMMGKLKLIRLISVFVCLSGNNINL